MLQTLEKQEDEKTVKEVKMELQRANSQITKHANIEEQRKGQIKNL